MSPSHLSGVKNNRDGLTESSPESATDGHCHRGGRLGPQASTVYVPLAVSVLSIVNS